MNKLGEVMLEVSEEWFADLPAPEEVPAYTYSKKYLKWEQEVIYGKKHVTLKRVAKVLLVAAILIIMLAVIALSTTKGREFILHFFNDSAVYSVDTHFSDSVESIKVDYLPVGYRLIDSFKGEATTYNEYVSGNNHLTVYKEPLNTITSFDLSGEELYFELNNITYIVSQSEDDYCTVIWNYHNYNYRICGVLSIDEALKIAQSVE